jgi:hypothetical protein
VRGPGLRQEAGAAGVPPLRRLGFRLAEHAALTGWAKLCRASGAEFGEGERLTVLFVRTCGVAILGSYVGG